MYLPKSHLLFKCHSASTGAAHLILKMAAPVMVGTELATTLSAPEEAQLTGRCSLEERQALQSPAPLAYYSFPECCASGDERSS